MSELRDGPLASSTLSCFGCKHLTSKTADVLGEERAFLYCKKKKNKMLANLHTPKWCPRLSNAIIEVTFA